MYICTYMYMYMYMYAQQKKLCEDHPERPSVEQYVHKCMTTIEEYFMRI